jgi:hypothetical protein
MGIGTSFPGIKRPGYESKHSPPATFGFTDESRYTSARLISMHNGHTGNCGCRQLTRVLFALSSVWNVDCEMLPCPEKKTHTHTNFTLVVRQGITTRRGQLTYAVLCSWSFLTGLVNWSIQMTFSYSDRTGAAWRPANGLFFPRNKEVGCYSKV